MQNSNLGLNINVTHRKQPSGITPSTKKVPEEDLQILDCADLLDDLYGSTWRKNADVILQSSEPRRNIKPLVDRAVQTEK